MVLYIETECRDIRSSLTAGFLVLLMRQMEFRFYDYLKKIIIDFVQSKQLIKSINCL